LTPLSEGDRPRRRFTVRRAERQAALASQPWPVFFRNLAIEIAIIAVIVVALAIWIWLSRP
jgi:hypothetical protein